MSRLVFLVMMPATIIPIFMRHRMWRAVTFTLSDLLRWAAWGFFVAVLFGPMGSALGTAYMTDFPWTEVIKLYVYGVTFSTLFGVIPYFAAVIGLPCAITAIIAAYACSRPVDPTE